MSIRSGDKLSNTKNKISEYKNPQPANKFQEHAIKFIHRLNKPSKNQLHKQAGSYGRTKVDKEVKNLINNGFVKQNSKKKLSLTEKGRKHL